MVFRVGPFGAAAQPVAEVVKELESEFAIIHTPRSMAQTVPTKMFNKKTVTQKIVRLMVNFRTGQVGPIVARLVEKESALKLANATVRDRVMVAGSV